MRSIGAVMVFATAPETPPKVKSMRKPVTPSFAMVHSTSAIGGFFDEDKP